jgi:hypothetical protein
MTETEMLNITLTGAELGALLDLALLSPCEYTEHQTSAVMKLATRFREINSQECRKSDPAQDGLVGGAPPQ